MRICSETDTRDLRLSELRDLLLARNYKPRLVDAAIEKAKKIPRMEALRKVPQKENKIRRPILVITFDPRLPQIPAILRKHWRTMTSDPYLKEVFPLPPMVAYKRPENIQEKLISSKIPPLLLRRPRRTTPGMKKCHNCTICPYVQNCKSVKSTATDLIVQINREVSCLSKNIIYCITCKKCKMQYIGESERTLKERFSEHLGYVHNEHLSKATGAHFNSKGHSVSDMEVTVLEKIYSHDEGIRKERESMFIKEFNTKRKGLNKKS